MKQCGWPGILMAALLVCATAATAQPLEQMVRMGFDAAPTENLLRPIWGDKPAEVLFNGMVPDGGANGTAAARLALRFGEETPDRLSYWGVVMQPRVPIVRQMQQIACRVRTNVPLSIKINIAPYGYTYHGPTVQPSDEWQMLAVESAFDELAAWCARTNRDAEKAAVSDVILALHTSPGVVAEVLVDEVTFTGTEGAVRRMAEEALKQRFGRVIASVVTLPWSDEGRTLEMVLDRLDEAGNVGSDIVCLPMECVKTEGETIPGPISTAIAAKAREYGMYVIGNIREKAEGKTFVTSFLCDRNGEIIGTYRKSHKMPDEDMDLGDDLPVFPTDLGPIAMRIGSDRYFADIDHVYTAKGARMIFWSQQPEPVEDEYLQDFPSLGRALDYRVFIACSRYSFAPEGWITNFFPPYRGSSIGRSYIVNREGMRIASTTRKGTIASAVIPVEELGSPGRGANRSPAFSVLTEPVQLPEKRDWVKRVVRLTAIENHVGFDDLLAKLDIAGEMGSDIVCTYEFVWLPIRPWGDEEAQRKAEAVCAERLEKIAEKARQWRMYVLVSGIIERADLNEAICYDREGNEAGRYRKIATTYPQQIAGEETPIIETDFGRFGVRICADNFMVELDRSYGVKGADIMFDLTQDWGPDAIHRNLRNISRAMDAQFFRVEATHSTSEVLHRSHVVEPSGIIVAQSQYMSNGLVSAVVDLDNDRPRRYVRNWTPFEPRGYLPQYQPTELPEVKNDLQMTILAQRRPELYQVLAPETPSQ